MAVPSSIDVLVPAASGLVAPWYAATPAATEGMPPHVTLLWPWLDAPVPAAGIDRVAHAVRDVRPFALRLGTVGRFAGVVYLEPEPRAVLDDLIARFVAAFPETPPYRGAFGSAPVPHLTVATSDDESHLDRVEHAVRAALDRPLVVEVDGVTVSEQGPGPLDRWSVRAEVALGP